MPSLSLSLLAPGPGAALSAGAGQLRLSRALHSAVIISGSGEIGSVSTISHTDINISATAASRGRARDS